MTPFTDEVFSLWLVDLRVRASHRVLCLYDSLMSLKDVYGLSRQSERGCAPWPLQTLVKIAALV